MSIDFALSFSHLSWEKLLESKRPSSSDDPAIVPTTGIQVLGRKLADLDSPSQLGQLVRTRLAPNQHNLDGLILPTISSAVLGEVEEGWIAAWMT